MRGTRLETTLVQIGEFLAPSDERLAEYGSYDHVSLAVRRG